MKARELELLDNVDWNALDADFGIKVLQLGAWRVATSTFVDEGKIFVSNRNSVVALHPNDWTTLGFDRMAMSDLLGEATGHWASLGPVGVRKLLDCHQYLDAVRAQEAANRPQVVDALEALAERARRLLVAASGLTTSQDRRQLALFGRELQALQSEIASTEQRVVKVRTLVALAEEAVCSAV